MKQLRLILLSGLVLLLSSCGMPDPPVGNDGIRVVVTDQSGGLDLLHPDSAVQCTAQVQKQPEQIVEGMLVEASIAGSDFFALEQAGAGPVALTYSLNELVAAQSAVSLNELRRGDAVILRLSARGIPDPEYTTAEYSLGCLSELAGDYQAITVGRAGPGGGGDFDTIRYNVSLSAIGDGRYELSELTGGMYPTVWGAKPEEGIFLDSCRVIRIPAQHDQWNDQISGSGDVLEDGTIHYSWENTYGDQGETWLRK